MVFGVDDVRDSQRYLLVKYSDHCSHSFAHGTSFGGLKQIHGSMSIRSSSSLHFAPYNSSCLRVKKWNICWVQRARRSHSLESSSTILNLSRVVFACFSIYFPCQNFGNEMDWTKWMHPSSHLHTVTPQHCACCHRFPWGHNGVMAEDIYQRAAEYEMRMRCRFAEISSNHLQSDFGNSRVSGTGSSRLLGLLLNQPLLLLLLLSLLLLLLLLLSSFFVVFVVRVALALVWRCGRTP